MIVEWTRKASILTIVGIGVVGVAIDQITKALAIAYLSPTEPQPVVSDLLQLILLRNPGAAFSTGTSITVVFSTLAVVAFVAICGWIIPRVKCRIWAVTTGLAVAGILGNLIDRLVREPGIMRGHVIDFLSLKHFAVFNVADVMLTSAAVLVVVCSLILKVNLDGRRFDEPEAKDPMPEETEED